MSSVICFGEALIDFLNTGTQQHDQLTLNNFTQYPGGAPANAAVAIAKLGGDARFLGQVGNDQFGEFLVDALNQYGVDTSLMFTHPSAKTTLAFVFLDDDGERSFSFRRQATADIEWQESQLDPNWFGTSSIFHFCSNTLTDPHIAHITSRVVAMAQESNLLVSFDVNLRHNLWQSGAADKNVVNAQVFASDIAKFSREEFDYLNSGNRESYLKKSFTSGVQLILITDAGDAIEVITSDWEFKVRPPDCEVVDTTGGGDGFIGAFLYGLNQQASPKTSLEGQAFLKAVVKFAAQCGAITVSRKGAIPALPDAHEVREFWVI